MTFFPDPIKPSESRSNDDIIVNPIEGDKKRSDKSRWQELPEKNRSVIYGTMLVLMKRIFTSFMKNKKLTLSDDELSHSIESLKNLLIKHQQTDQSENSHFCQKLSDTWNLLHEHIHLALRAKVTLEVDLSKVKKVLSEMDHYPPDEEHNLGFYLSHFAGEDWLPVPFMNILKKLHENAKEKNKESVLSDWIKRLEES